jgi:hypothetical protein
MNIFIRELASGKVSDQPDIASSKLIVEDNIGESIHVHWRNVRFEMSINDYYKFANEINSAKTNLKNGNY